MNCVCFVHFSWMRKAYDERHGPAIPVFRTWDLHVHAIILKCPNSFLANLFHHCKSIEQKSMTENPLQKMCPHGFLLKMVLVTILRKIGF